MHTAAPLVTRKIERCRIGNFGGETLVEIINEKGNWVIYKDNERYPYSLSTVISIWN